MKTAIALLAALTCGLADHPLVAAPVPKVKEKSTEEKLLGTWRLTGGTHGPFAENRLFLYFLPEGKLRLVQNVGQRGEYTREGTYKVVDGTKIDYTVTTAGYEKQEVLRITRLTDDELVFVDPDDIREEFVRLSDDKN